MYLKFPISNGEIHSTHETLSEFPGCIIGCHDTDNMHSSDTNESLCTSASQAQSITYHSDKSYVSYLLKFLWKSYNSLDT